MPGCGSACSSPARAGPENRNRVEQEPGPVPLLLGAVADDLRQRGAVHPLGDQHVVGLGDDAGHEDVGVAGVRRGEGALRVGLQVVVELLGDPVAQLVEQRLDVEAGHQHAEQPAEPAELGEVAEQGLARARVLDLDGDRRGRRARPPGAPGRSRRRPRACRRRLRTSPASPAPSSSASTRCTVPAGSGGADSCSLVSVARYGPGELRRQRRLEDRQRLAELHRPALELAEHLEDLLGGALLDLLRDDLGGAPADPLADPERGAAGEPQRQPGELDAALHAAPRHVIAPVRGRLAHTVILRQ